MKPEAKVKAAIRKLLKAHDVWYFMPSQTGLGRKGIPDFICCLRGTLLVVEAKATSKSPVSELQKHELAAIELAGGVALVIHKDNLHKLENILTTC